ncbi:MAG: membrane lipoprotein lipid attachment site-containing protein [Candidatus Aegiribacteria sp.]|nr:membrane lipoprotein lipid attachment site-containing protein [Candidatus Aegiribacteria sp.]
MKRITFIALIAVLLSGCTRESTQLIDQEEMDRIRGDLNAQACLSRIDSLGFEIDSILYYAGINEDDRPLTELLPDSIPVCPVSGLDYIINETESEVTITCPSGHGSLTVEK